MKIGFDAKRFYHNNSGLGNYSRYLVEHLHQLIPQDELFLYASKESNHVIPSNAKFRRIPSPSSLRRFWNLNTLWKKDKLDVYHGLSNELPLNASSKVKKVVTIHDLLYQDFPADYPWVDRKIYQLKFKTACEQADAVVAISQATKKDILERFGIKESKVHIIYQSCDPSYFEKVSQSSVAKALDKRKLQKPYFICVGSFTHRKNQKRLIEAFAHSNLTSQMDLVFVGRSNSFLNQLQQVSSQFKLEEIVHFLTDVDGDELKSLVQGSHSIVYPSIKEGFGLPVLEGLAMGKAVITSRNTSCHEAGGDAVLTFDAHSTEELTSQLENIVKDDSLRLKLENLGVSQAKRFSPSEELPKLIKLYGQLIS